METDIFDFELKNHILYEFFSGVPNKENILRESRGVVGGVHETVRDLVNAMSDQVMDAFKGNEPVSKEYSSRNVAVGSTFFKNFNISITVQKSDDLRYRGGLVVDNSFSETTDGKARCHPEINLKIQAKTPEEAMNVLKFALGHELTHAYNIFKYAEKNGIRLLSRNINTEQGYQKIQTARNSVVNNESAIGTVMYLLNRMERNAYIAQLKQELNEKSDSIVDGNTAMEAIKSTESYKKLSQIASFLDQLRMGELTQTTKIWLTRYTNNVTGKNFTTYEQVLRYFTGRYEKWKKKYMITASKIAYDIYSENHIMMDGDMSSNVITIK